MSCQKTIEFGCFGRLATQAFKKERIEKKIFASSGVFKNELELYEKNTSKEIWTQSKGNFKHSSAYIIGYEEGITEKLLKCKRKDLRVLVGIFTGHAITNQFLKRIKKKSDEKCRFCRRNVVETMAHWMEECGHLKWSRFSHLDKFFPKGNEISKVNIWKILKFSKEAGIHDTFFNLLT